MTAIEKLDYILVQLKPFAGHYLSIIEIAKNAEVINHMNVNELPPILNKLVTDGNADFEISEFKDSLYESNKIYTISFEGIILIENGGYKRKGKKESISTKLQSLQTWAIAVGTALAGLYGLYELIKAILTASYF